VGEDDRIVPFDAVFAGGERASQHRRDAERLEVVSAHPLTVQPLWPIRVGHGWIPWLHHRKCVERLASLGEFAERGEGDVNPEAAQCGVPDRDDAFWMRVRERREQNRVDGAEDGRARADAERQGENAHAGKTRTGAQSARAIPEIGSDGRDQVLPAAVPHGFTHAGHAAHLDPRRTARLGRRQAGRYQGGGGLIDVVFDLVGHILIGPGSPREDAHAVCELAP
jgi:hypothetical protein